MTKRSKPPVAIYSALGDATRCRIVEILLAGPIPVHKLADAFAISRPAISRHLRVLKTAGLVAEVKKGRENLYALKAAKLATALKWLNAVAGVESAATEPPIEARAAVEAAPSKPAPETKPAIPVPPAELTLPADDQPLFADKRERAPRAAKAPAVSQMGFDF